MSTRHEARLGVISLLYAREFAGANSEPVGDPGLASGEPAEERVGDLAGDPGEDPVGWAGEFLDEQKIQNEHKDFAFALYRGVLEKGSELDRLIEAKLKEGSLAKLGLIERAILRLGAYELLFTPTDAAVIINEAIELAKDLAGDEALINALLDALSKDKNAAHHRP